MAFPTIIIDSATGSDTAASGAGPATALTGSSGATSSDGLTVTLDGSPDLSALAVDGSAAIYLNNTTAGARNFAKITAANNTSKTVTVSEAFAVNLTGKSWAIGGRRLSLAGVGSTSGRLYNNNGAVGDAMPGWTIQLANAHSETIATNGGPEGNGRIWWRRSGDVTSGPITIQGEPGATTRPVLIFANSTPHAFYSEAGFVVFANFDVQNSAASKGIAAFTLNNLNNQDNPTLRGMKIGTSTNAWLNGVAVNSEGIVIRDCEIGYSTGTSVNIVSGNGGVYIRNCYIHGMTAGTAAVYINNAILSIVIADNIIQGNACPGIVFDTMRGAGDSAYVISGNTIDGNTGSGVKINAYGLAASGLWIVNNILASNSTYGLEFNQASYTDAALAALAPTILNNQTFNNTSGAYKSATAGRAYNACPWASGDNNLDPTYTLAASGDYSIGTNLKAKGYPLGGTLKVGTTSATYSYVDPGAAQRQEAAATTYIFGGEF